jgi:hypothetical protein
MGIVAEKFVKRRCLANRSVDQIGSFRPLPSEDVYLHGSEQRGRGVGVLRQQCLAADDDQFVDSGDGAGRANHNVPVHSVAWSRNSR